MANPLVKDYVDAAIARLRRMGLMRTPGSVPEVMRDASIAPSRDWIGWRPIPSSVTDTELNDLEHETKLAFPTFYREFLQYQHFVDLTQTGFQFERHLPSVWRDTLRRAYFRSWPRERILDVGLLPFGSETMMGAGPVCFDTRARLPDGDCPIVYWDHEWVGDSKEIGLLFSSCAKMFPCLKLAADNDVNFLYHDESDDQELLPKKVELMNRFLALDPNGAGGPARAYWTSWGVQT